MNNEETKSLYYALYDMGELDQYEEITGEWSKDYKFFMGLLKSGKISF